MFFSRRATSPNVNALDSRSRGLGSIYPDSLLALPLHVGVYMRQMSTGELLRNRNIVNLSLFLCSEY